MDPSLRETEEPCWRETRDVNSADSRYNLSAEIDPHNTGVLVVDLQGRTMGGRTRDAGGIVDRMGDKDADCVIM